MENTELKHILVAYKSTNIGLQQAHDEILRLFSVVGRSEQLKALLEKLLNENMCSVAGDELIEDALKGF
jgi:hypothetical protein